MIKAKRQGRHTTLLFLILWLFNILAGCGSGGSSGTGFNGGAAGDLVSPTKPSSDFVGYLYGPSAKSKEATQTGLIVLQKASAPSGYQAVSGATVYMENNPSLTTTTDGSGMFTIQASGIKSTRGAADTSYLVCVPPEIGPFSMYAPTKCECHQVIHEDANIKKVILHPNARNIQVGEVIQLYAKAVLEDGGVRYMDPTQVTWQVDNGAIATVSSAGIATGIATGKAYVTITFGGQSCTGMLHVKKGEAFYTLRGTVHDSTGKTVPGALVVVSGLDAAAIVKADGTYVFPGIPGNEDLALMVYLHGTLKYMTTIRLTSDASLAIILPADLPRMGSISGTVTEKEGGVLEGVLVSTGDWSTTTDSAGYYSLTEIPSGSYRFSFSTAGYGSVTNIQEIPGGSVATLDVTLQKNAVMTTGTLNGRVIDSLNAGIAGASVSYGGRGKLQGRGAATTDSSGFFSFADVPAGDYRVQAGKEGYIGNSADVTVKAGEDTNTTITLQTLPVPSPSPTSSPVPTPSVSPTPSPSVTPTFFPTPLPTPTPTPTPAINAISSSTVEIGDRITLTGNNFGDSQGSSVVKFEDKIAAVIAWGATSITCNVPTGAVTGKVSVTVNAIESNKVDYTVSVRHIWTSLGTSSTSQSYWTSIFIDNGTIYTAFHDHWPGGGGRAKVAKYSGTGVVWDAIGVSDDNYPGVATTYGTDYNSLQVHNGIPWLATREGNTTKVSVRRYNPSTDKWVYVGSPGFSEGAALYVSHKFIGDTPYVAYSDAGLSLKAVVKKFNGTDWVAVGGPVSDGEAVWVSLVIIDGVPYVGYRDMAIGYKAIVKKFDGTDWVDISTGLGYSANSVHMAVCNGIAYITYNDHTIDYKIRVMKYNGTSWSLVGKAGDMEIGDSISMCVYNDIPYVSFVASGGGKVYKCVNNAWIDYGYAFPEYCGHNYIEVWNNIPYVIHQDIYQGGKAFVNRCDF